MFLKVPFVVQTVILIAALSWISIIPWYGPSLGWVSYEIILKHRVVNCYEQRTHRQI